MIILDWVCDNCGYEQRLDDSSEPLSIKELMEFSCEDCGDKYEMVINKA